MANYTPTCSEYSIDVPAPKDAEGRRVLLDTKVMYNDAGVEYMVSGFVFDTRKLAAGWDVKCFTPSDDIVYTRPPWRECVRLFIMHRRQKRNLRKGCHARHRIPHPKAEGRGFNMANAMKMDVNDLVVNGNE